MKRLLALPPFARRSSAPDAAASGELAAALADTASAPVSPRKAGAAPSRGPAGPPLGEGPPGFPAASAPAAPPSSLRTRVVGAQHAPLFFSLPLDAAQPGNGANTATTTNNNNSAGAPPSPRAACASPRTRRLAGLSRSLLPPASAASPQPAPASPGVKRVQGDAPSPRRASFTLRAPAPLASPRAAGAPSRWAAAPLALVRSWCVSRGADAAERAAVWRRLAGGARRGRRAWCAGAPVDDGGASLRQIELDLWRTLPTWRDVASVEGRRAIARVCNAWALAHPACGYVQGQNDLAAPLVSVFLEARGADSPALLADAAWREIEADAARCMSRLMRTLYMCYADGLARVHSSVAQMERLVERLDPFLWAHMCAQNVMLVQCCLTWLMMLLVRTLPRAALLRLWDAYLASECDFFELHVHVCAVLVVRLAPALRRLDAEAMASCLANPPTAAWGGAEASELLATAYALVLRASRAPSPRARSPPPGASAPTQ